MLSVFLCNSKSEKYPGGGTQQATGITTLNTDSKSELEVIMGETLADRRVGDGSWTSVK